MNKELIEKYNLNEEAVSEIDKAIQSESDKVRTEYSQKLKVANEELEKLKPHEPTESEVELAKTKSELNQIKLEKSLIAAGIDSNFAKYLKSDIDIDALSESFKGLVTTKQPNFKPNNRGGVGVTKEDFRKMGYDEKAKLYNENPTLYTELSN
jgi:hypothetical protein